METIQFNTIVNPEEQVIRPPDGVELPQGVVEVTVRFISQPAVPHTDPLEKTRNWLLALATEAEQAAPDLPTDMAEHHDHYAHGKPLP
jgi:hypothetical protein